MRATIRPVVIGFIFGFSSLFFGIFWAVYLVVNHDTIHKTLETAASASISAKTVAESSHTTPHNHVEVKHSHAHDGHVSGYKDDADAVSVEHGNVNARHEEGAHENPLQKAAHERLVRGHIHAMGLGLVAICVSLVLALLSAPARVKTLASACLGVGGFVYPFSWIIMGYRTPAIGFNAAQESVLPIVAISLPLVLAGLLICFFYLLKTAFTRG